MTEIDIDALIGRSTQYDRAAKLIEDFIHQLSTQNNKTKWADDADPAYGIVLDRLKPLQKELQNEGDTLWQIMEQTIEPDKIGLQNLANAMLATAAQDYAESLCGAWDQKDGEKDTHRQVELRMIERFAQSEACEIYSNVDFSAVLERIRNARDEFVKLVRTKKDAIEEETKESDKKRRDYSYNKVRCPLCGGGLYMDKQKHTAFKTFRCTGCKLQEVIYKRA